MKNFEKPAKPKKIKSSPMEVLADLVVSKEVKEKWNREFVAKQNADFSKRIKELEEVKKLNKEDRKKRRILLIDKERREYIMNGYNSEDAKKMAERNIENLFGKIDD